MSLARLVNFLHYLHFLRDIKNTSKTVKEIFALQKQGRVEEARAELKAQADK